MITIIETNTALDIALKANGYDNVTEAIYDLMGVTPNSSMSAAGVYRGIATLVFESMLGDCWLGLALGHSAFVATGQDYAEAKAGLLAAIDRVLDFRSLSPMEQQQNNALVRAIAALHKIEGKDGVQTLSAVLTSVLANGRGGAMQESCRYLAMQIGATDCDVSDKTREWSEQNLLKQSVTSNEIESMIRTRSAMTAPEYD